MGLIIGTNSSVLELTLPRESVGRFDLPSEPEVIWIYSANGENNVCSLFMNKVQGSPNECTLITQACDKRIVEVTSEGEMVLDFQVGLVAD